MTNLHKFLPLIFLVIFMAFSTGCLSYGDMKPVVPQGPDNISVVTDSLGNTISFTKPVSRIVTQNSDAIEMLVGIGAEDKIVGVAENTMKDPDIAKRIPGAKSIGDWQNPNIEAILSLSPDVMITYGGRTKNIDQVLAANITVVSLDFYRVTDIAREARTLGKITGKQEKAEEYALFVEGYLDLLSSRLSANRSHPPLVYMEHYGDYSAEGWNGGGTQLLRMLNASQIGADLPGLTQKVTPEWIIQQKPEVIIKTVSSKDMDQEDLDAVRESIMKRQGFDSIPAVQSGRVHVIHGDILNSPRGVAGVFYLARALYPDEFNDVDPDMIIKEYARRFYPGADEAPRCSPAR